MKFNKKYFSLGLILFIVIFSLIYFKSFEKKTIKKVKRKEQFINFELEGTVIFFKKNTVKQIKKIDVEIADSDFERERGLMYRRFMPDNVGMIFIFKDPSPQSFWMKNTHIALDLLFISEDGEIQKISPNASPYSEESIRCDKKSKYVLEVNEGFCANYKIKEGDKITLDRKNK